MWNPLRIFARNNEIISVEQQIENLPVNCYSNDRN